MTAILPSREKSRQITTMAQEKRLRDSVTLSYCQDPQLPVPKLWILSSNSSVTTKLEFSQVTYTITMQACTHIQEK